MKIILNHEKVIEENPKVDKVLVANFERLKLELQRLGVDTRSTYSLNSPLGDGVGIAFSQSSCLDY